MVMTKLISREIKVSIPVFIFVIFLAVVFGYLYPQAVPVGFGLDGIANDWVSKSAKSYHIPLPELLAYLLFTLLQVRYCLHNASLNDYLFNAKIATILCIGMIYPLATYLYAIKAISNFWIIAAPILGGLSIYLFILYMFSDLTGKTLENKKHGIGSFKKKKRFKKGK